MKIIFFSFKQCTDAACAMFVFSQIIRSKFVYKEIILKLFFCKAQNQAEQCRRTSHVIHGGACLTRRQQISLGHIPKQRRIPFIKPYDCLHSGVFCNLRTSKERQCAQRFFLSCIICLLVTADIPFDVFHCVSDNRHFYLLALSFLFTVNRILRI